MMKSRLVKAQFKSSFGVFVGKCVILMLRTNNLLVLIKTRIDNLIKLIQHLLPCLPFPRLLHLPSCHSPIQIGCEGGHHQKQW